jgi:UDP-glucose-4-epimerase GalE
MARVLVTGGAGYVGSHCARQIALAGHEVVTLDRMTQGHRGAVTGELVVADLRDRGQVHRVLERGFDAVFHFAALMSVGDSARDPIGYLDNNVGGTLALLDAMRATGTRDLVVSSTCAVYGIPDVVPIPESTPFRPISVYGETKAMMERILDHARAIGTVRVASLRYFNAAGASDDGSLGEAHDPETHLIPLAMRAAVTGQPITLFGDDYPTPDGTCIRDYVHVDDLADAHLAAWARLRDGDPGGAWNLGSGTGSSNLEVLRTLERVTGLAVPFRWGPRREGDPPALIGDNRRARADLGWTPQRDLTRILTDAWRWFQHPRFGPRVPGA